MCSFIFQNDKKFQKQKKIKSFSLFLTENINDYQLDVKEILIFMKALYSQFHQIFFSPVFSKEKLFFFFEKLAFINLAGFITKNYKNL